MPKRDGPKKGHKCGKEFDRYCPNCWEERLKTLHLTEFAGADTDKVTYTDPSKVALIMERESAEMYTGQYYSRRVGPERRKK